MDGYEFAIETQNETVGENEKLSVYKKLCLDNNILLFVVNLAHNFQVHLAEDHAWFSIILNGHITPVPTFYFYFLGLSINEATGERTVEIGVINWLHNIYCRVYALFQVYPVKSKYVERGTRKWINSHSRILDKVKLALGDKKKTYDKNIRFIQRQCAQAFTTFKVNSFWPEQHIVNICMDINRVCFSQGLAQILRYQEIAK